jgi:hypothetical protein
MHWSSLAPLIAILTPSGGQKIMQRFGGGRHASDLLPTPYIWKKKQSKWIEINTPNITVILNNKFWQELPTFLWYDADLTENYTCQAVACQLGRCLGTTKEYTYRHTGLHYSCFQELCGTHKQTQSHKAVLISLLSFFKIRKLVYKITFFAEFSMGSERIGSNGWKVSL